MPDYKQNTDGVAATEFALITPILVLILIGIVDYGVYMNTRMKLENTARSAAEYVFLEGDINKIEEHVIAHSDFYEADGLPDNMDVSHTFVCECTGGVSASCDETCDDGYMRKFVEVQINMDYEPLFAWPGLAKVMSMSGTARYQVE